MCACVRAFVSAAYKEKVKELPLVSLFCTCLNPQTADKPTYKAEGKEKALSHLHARTSTQGEVYSTTSKKVNLTRTRGRNAVKTTGCIKNHILMNNVFHGSERSL